MEYHAVLGLPITPKEKVLRYMYDPHRVLIPFHYRMVLNFLMLLLFRSWYVLYPRVRSILINQRAAC
jgi:hypothetical protein